MSKFSTRLTSPINSTILQTRMLTWTEQAEKHFYNGYYSSLNYVNPVDEHLMYLCIFASVGMFD